MKILMVTNTFAPHVGGVAKSIAAFSNAYRDRGHQVLTVAPTFENMPEDEADVFRVPALQNFNGSDFSVAVPVAGELRSAVERFAPDIIHSHHPFLLGSAALRLAHLYDRPLLFTHHTLYEQYTHYVPGDSPTLRRFVVSLATSYANQCNAVIAPSESISRLLVERGVVRPVSVVPTGVRLDEYARGSGEGFRAAMGIPNDAFVVGHVGRLAPEKNLDLMATAAAQILQRRDDAHCLIVGAGPSAADLPKVFTRHGVAERLHMTGALRQPLLGSAYQSMDVFAFTSHSETQGMVLTEAMAARVPVVALDAPGVREVVTPHNGRLLAATATAAEMAVAIADLAALPGPQRAELRAGALDTARAYSLERSVDRALELYLEMIGNTTTTDITEHDAWTTAMRLIEAEWTVMKGIASSAEDALSTIGEEVDELV